MRTSQQLKERFLSYRRNLYANGEKIGRDHEMLEPAMKMYIYEYDLQFDPKYHDLFTVISPTTGNRISLFNCPQRSPEEVIKKIEAIRVLTQLVGGCAARCGAVDLLSGVALMTYEADEACGTEYHPRFLKYLQKIQEEDLMTTILLTDAKGDRSKRPHQQSDPDMYLRIVEKKSDGIVINGCKLFGGTAMMDEITVAPTRALSGPEESQYAVSFSIPGDWDNVHILCKPVKGRSIRNKYKSPIEGHGMGFENWTIFDNTFVPWDRVWLCGEWKHAAAGAHYGSLFHRTSYTGCKPATADLIMGAAALIAEYNGLEKISHIREKLAHLAATAELIHATGIAGAMKGKKHGSGFWLPEPVFINAGRYHAGMNIYHEYETLADIAGGMGINIPTEEDFMSPDIGRFIQKYIKRKADIPAENIWRLFKLVDEMLYSEQAGWYKAAGLHGGGSPIMEKIGILSNYDFEMRKGLIKHLAGIKK